MSQQTEFVYVPIRASLVSEIILRKREHVNVGALVTNLVEDLLERTRGEPDLWSAEHAEEVAEEDAAAATHGDPAKGYQWQAVFMPNGTRIRMPYQGRYHYAQIEHETLVHDGQKLSPSEFASAVANGTNRNAWRDLWLQFPRTSEWRLADTIRKSRAGDLP